MTDNFLRAIFALLLISLACQPVFVIGWREFLLVFILAVLLIGPLIYRFIRRVEKSLKEKGKLDKTDGDIRNAN